MLFINQYKKPRVQKHLLSLELADAMLLQALTTIAVIPVKPDGLAQINHICILP